MPIFEMVLIVFGLVLFEIVSSIDNAIINADVLHTVGEKARRWFLTWGLLFAVFIVRGLLPWLIIWLATPDLGPVKAFTATISSDPLALAAIERSAPLLLMGGGVFLFLLFLHWLFLEEKTFGLPGEKFVAKHGVWFFACASIFLAVTVWNAIAINPYLAFAAVVGSTAFFIIHGFRENAEKAEGDLVRSNKSDWSKIVFLEMIDLSFSIDGVLGAFAFTLAIPLILLGNGIGALVVRQLTIGNIDRIKRYVFLKNGAMYSILMLGMVMIAEGFGAHIPSYFSPVATLVIVTYFFAKSKKVVI